MTVPADSVFRQTPLVWRSTLRGVLVLAGDELQLLEGLAASMWLVLDDVLVRSSDLDRTVAVVQEAEEQSLYELFVGQTSFRRTAASDGALHPGVGGPGPVPRLAGVAVPRPSQSPPNLAAV